jgi:hypothetical protein
MAAIAVAGVGLMVVCSSSLAAAMMMGDKEETPATTTTAGPSGPDPEVFHILGYTYTKPQAEAGCAEYDAKLATDAQFTAAYDAGANWCSTGWLSDTDVGAYPINDEASFVSGCGGTSAGIRRANHSSGKAGLNCYGVKPDEGTEKVARFNTAKWSRYD